MGRSERVVDVDVRQRSKTPRKVVVIRLFTRVKTQVLQHADLTTTNGGRNESHFRPPGPTAVDDIRSENLCETLSDRSHSEVWRQPSLGTAQMRTHYERCPPVKQVLDGRKGRNNA